MALKIGRRDRRRGKAGSATMKAGALFQLRRVSSGRERLEESKRLLGREEGEGRREVGQ